MGKLKNGSCIPAARPNRSLQKTLPLGLCLFHMPDEANPLRLRLADQTKKPADYVHLAREVQSGKELNLPLLRVAFLSTFSIELLKPALVVELAVRGFRLDAFFGPFNQFEQLVLNPNSELFSFDPEVIVLAVRPEDTHPNQLCRLLSYDTKERDSLRADLANRLENLTLTIRSQVSSSILVWNVAEPATLAAACADAALDSSEQQFVAALNKDIASVARGVSETHVFDLHRASCEIGIEQLYDHRMQVVAHIPFSSVAQIRIAREHAKCIALLRSKPKKCLVVDLDNTLWGGVVGEVGSEGIDLGEDYPGSAFVSFHRYLISLKCRGILLAVASKNNEPDALDVLANHPSSTLRPGDFADLQIHWGDKATSLRKIADNLNIGLDSLCFFDDNPVERAWVKAELPEVHVFDVPPNPMAFPAIVESSGLFDSLSITGEDLNRSALYQVEKQRRDFQRCFENVNDFLQSLETVILHEQLDRDSPHFGRVAQLLSRTNQFNLTTRRHNSADLGRLIQNGGIGILIWVSDRFGSHGLVGFALAIPLTNSPAEEWRIDTFLLSCRVLGRRIESALLSLLVDRIRMQSNQAKIIGEFLATQKNVPTRKFYHEHGFELIDETAERVEYILNGSDSPELPDLYQIKENSVER